MKRRLLVLAFMGLSPSLIWAQENDSIKVQTLEEITISSVRASKDAPVAQVTVNRKEIQAEFQGQDGAFLLERLSPSIVSYSQSGTNFSNYGEMRLRGIDQTRINITLNGVPLNDMIDQGVFFSNFTDFGNSIESVQIQRGVGTSSNGVASYAGSVNFESISLAQQKPSAEVQLTAGSFNTFRGSAEVHTGLLENRTAFYAKMSTLQSDGYRYHSGTASNSLFFSGGYFGDKHSFKFTGFAGRTENELAYAPVLLSQIELDPRSNDLSTNDVDDFGQYLFQLQHTWRTGEKSAWVNTAYYGGAGGDFPFSYTDSSTATNISTINYPLENRHLGWLSNYSTEYSFGKLDFGVHLYRFERENIEYIEPNAESPYYQDESLKEEFAAFIKWQKAFGPLKFHADAQLRQLALSLGGDASFLGEEPNIPSRSFTFINPKVGASYDLRSNWNVYASFGRSGREPTRADILGSATISLANIAAARNTGSVDPEFVNDLELGSRWSNDVLKLDFNLYYMIFENEIAPIGLYDEQNFYQVFENQESSFRRGAELMFSYTINSQLELRGQAAYLDARISEYSPAGLDVVYTDIRPILSPEFNGNVQLVYSPNSRLNFTARARFLGEQFMELSNDPNLVVPASTILDLSASWQFLNQHEFSLQLNNLTDALYYTYGAPGFDGTAAYLVQAPFNIYGTLRLVF